MTEKQLKELRSTYKEIDDLREKISELENMRLSPRSASYGSERVQASARGDVQADNIAKIESLLKRYNARLRACLNLIQEFENALEKLDSRERRIMTYYYMDCMTWEAVCVEINISWMQLHRIRKEIIKKINN